MSTSNIKSPVSIRQGYITPWNSSFQISKKEHRKLVKMLMRELEGLNITLIDVTSDARRINIYYYKWAQLPFKSKWDADWIYQFESSLQSINKNPLNSTKSGIKIHATHVKKLFDWGLADSINYKIPVSLELYINEQIFGIVGQNCAISYSNICNSTTWGSVIKGFDLIDFVNNTPLVKSSVRSTYHLVDAILIYNCLSKMPVVSLNLLSQLVGQLLTRSTKKGLFVRTMRLIAKLPFLINQYDIKKKSSKISHTWNWVIKISGKLGGTGRTKTYWIRPIKLPLHTLNNNVNYEELFVNTKTGAFSVKLWQVF